MTVDSLRSEVKQQVEAIQPACFQPAVEDRRCMRGLSQRIAGMLADGQGFTRYYFFRLRRFRARRG